MKFSQHLIVGLAIVLLMCSCGEVKPVEESGNDILVELSVETHNGHSIYLLQDKETGCQYFSKLNLDSSYIVPRMNPEGKQICKQ